ncbi:MAG: LamG-like jellyroll fold domain-containing protein [Planctomycetota bacterium]
MLEWLRRDCATSSILILIAVILAGPSTASAQYAKFRLYDFEDGTPGATANSTADVLVDPFIAGTVTQTITSANGLTTVTGVVDVSEIAPILGLSAKVGVRNGDLLSAIQNTRAQVAPPLTLAGGSPNFIDISPGSGLENTRAINLTGTTALEFNAGDVLQSVGHQNYDVNQDFGFVAFNGSNVFRGFTFLTQAWVRPDSASDGTRQIVFNMGDETGGVGISASGFWEALALGPAGDPQGSGSITSNVEVEFDEWAHVAILRAANTSLLYINGSLAASQPPTGVGFFNNYGEFVTIGTDDQDIFGSDANFDGLIDNFNIAGPANGAGFSQFDDIDFFSDTGVEAPPTVAGDVNGDDVVDRDDYLIWSANAGFNNDLNIGDLGTRVLGDVDQNGAIDFFDFRIIQREATAAGNNLFVVPEPATASVLMILGAAAALRRRRRQDSCETSRTTVPPRSVPGVRVLIAAVAALIATAHPAAADVVVAEDFFYPGQPTLIIDNLGGFGGNTSFAGGQDGPGGQWETRWTSGGSSTISTDTDNTRAGIRDNPFTGVSNMLSAFSGLGRDYTLDGDIEAEQTLYFAASFAVDLVNRDPFGAANSHFGIVSPGTGAALVQTPLISIGVTGPQGDADTVAGGGTSTFFAQLGGQTATGDVASDANDFINDGGFHRVVGRLEVNANGANEVLTAWIDPVGVETSAGSTIVTEADILTGWDDASVGLFATLMTIDTAVTPTFLQREHYFDDVAIGTTFESVQSVAVPRLTLEVNQTSGNVKLVNNTSQDVDLSFYQITSESGSLDPTGWNSLDDQGVDEGVVGDYNGDGSVTAADYTVFRDTLGSTVDLRADGDNDGEVDIDDYTLWADNFGQAGGGGEAWLENSAETTSLIESNFANTSVLPAGGSYDLGEAFAGGTLDLVARYGTSNSFSGLLNVATVVDVTPGAAAIPEPHAAAIGAVLLVLGGQIRKKH